jgi:outer membrane protein|uniref:OmpH family outer membrane protein n=1 Tax=Polaribacter sp. TaxID=1920175 RepID=UPI00404741D2
MKLKITLLAAMLLSSFAIQAQNKVGTVDSEYVISKMPQLTAVQTRISSYGTKLDSSFSIKVKEYDTKVDAFNKAEKTMTEEVKKTKYAEIAELDQDLKKFRQNGAQLMQIRRDELLRPLYKKVTEVIAEVAKANGYSQILTITGNELAYLDTKFDITKLVLAKLGIKEDPEPKK